MAHDILGNLERLGWTVFPNGGGTRLLRKGALVLSGFDGDLPDDHWFTVTLWPDFDSGESEHVWGLSDGTAEFADCGPAMALHDAIATAETVEREYRDEIAGGDAPEIAARTIRVRQLQGTLDDFRSLLEEERGAASPCPDAIRFYCEEIHRALASKWVSRIGLGFHPDTRGDDYSPPLGDAATIAEYDRDISQMFELPGCPYASGLAAMERAGLIKG